MTTMQIGLALACFTLAVSIFIFADGYRRVYSGIFFLVLGVVLLKNAWRPSDQDKE